jgi:hypothetical protein
MNCRKQTNCARFGAGVIQVTQVVQVDSAQSKPASPLNISHFFSDDIVADDDISHSEGSNVYRASLSHPSRPRSASIESMEEDLALIGCAESTDEPVHLCSEQDHNTSRMPIVVSTRSISSLDFVVRSDIKGYLPASNRSSMVSSWSQRKPRHVVIDTPYRKQVRLQTCPTCHHAISSSSLEEERQTSLYDSNVNQSAFDFSDDGDSADDERNDYEPESAWSEDEEDEEVDDEAFLSARTTQFLSISSPPLTKRSTQDVNWGVAY